MPPDFFKAPILMGILNITPDSFYDGGNLDSSVDEAVNYAQKMIAHGGQILDVGGESTRPGAAALTPEEEQARVLPVIKALKQECPDILISVDTRNAATMRAAIDAGAGMINDITALTYDLKSLSVAAEHKLPVCLMHMQGEPKTMQEAPHYDDVLTEVYDYLARRIDVCTSAGLDQKQIIIDPGIGFGKTLKHNLTLLNQIDKFHTLGCAVMLGASRKRFIEKLIPNTPAENRLPGSLAAALWGFEKGVQIFRVHDVPETAQAFQVFSAISSTPDSE